MPRTATKRFPTQPQVTDTFTRADSSTTLGSTESGGFAYSVLGSGVYGINTNKAAPISSSTDNPAYIDVGTPDALVSVVVDTFPGGANEQGVYFRIVSTAAWWRFIRSTSSIILQRRVASSNTTVATKSETFANGDIFSVRCWGDTIQCFKNGVRIFSVVDSANNSATKFGFGCGTGSASARFDSFNVTYKI